MQYLIFYSIHYFYILCLCGLLSGMLSSTSFLFFLRCCENLADGLNSIKMGQALYVTHKKHHIDLS